MTKSGTGTFNNTRIEAAYTNMSKADIVRRGLSLGIDYSKTWSCYKNGEHQCGKCGTCVERREAFQVVGVEDPLTSSLKNTRFVID